MIIKATGKFAERVVEDCICQDSGIMVMGNEIVDYSGHGFIVRIGNQVRSSDVCELVEYISSKRGVVSLDDYEVWYDHVSDEYVLEEQIMYCTTMSYAIEMAVEHRKKEFYSIEHKNNCVITYVTHFYGMVNELNHDDKQYFSLIDTRGSIESMAHVVKVANDRAKDVDYGSYKIEDYEDFLKRVKGEVK